MINKKVLYFFGVPGLCQNLRGWVRRKYLVRRQDGKTGLRVQCMRIHEHFKQFYLRLPVPCTCLPCTGRRQTGRIRAKDEFRHTPVRLSAGSVRLKRTTFGTAPILNALSHIVIISAKYLLIAFIILSCDSMFGPIDNTPAGNFNLLFSYLNRDYAYKDDHPFTMESLKSKYLLDIQASPTEQTLAEIFANLENDLLDPHFNAPDEVYTQYGQTEPDYSLQKDIADKDDTLPSVTGYNGLTVLNEDYYFFWGKVTNKQHIGYIYIKNLSDEFGQSLLQGSKWRNKIETILKEFTEISVESIIVDIRSEAGGSNYNGLYIANRFANTRNAYMVEEFEGDHGQYRKKTFYVKPDGKYGFREGKVALLINNNTCSGGEMFVLAMRQRDNLATFGTPTRGCAGAIINRDIYNGWNFRFTSSRTTGPNGEEYFKKGIAPDNRVKDDPATPVADEVLNAAIAWLEQ